MHRFMFFLFVISLVSMASAPTFNVNGKVLDNVGIPIDNAVVELVRQGLKDTTGPDGAYSFSNKTAVELPSLLPATGQLSLKRGVLELRLPGPSPVRIEVFNLKGTLLQKELLQDAGAGLHRLKIAENCRTANLLFIRATIGNREITFPYLPLNIGNHQVKSSVESPSPFTREPAKKMIDNEIDTLKATAPGYMTNIVEISLRHSVIELPPLEVYITLKKIDTMLVKSDIPQKAPSIPNDQLKSLVHSNTLFAFDLYRNLQTSGDNIFFSPYSISEALAMTYGGAKNETSVQMANTLRFTLPDSIVHAGFNSLDRSLSRWAAQESAYTLNNANSIWMQEDYPFQKGYLDLLAAYYNTGFYAADFKKDPDSSRIMINNWMSEMTASRINDCLPEGALSTLTRLVLVNALYFKSMWNDTFAVADTRDSTFFNLDSTTSTVPFMHARIFDEKYFETDRYQATELMLAAMRTSMLIVMPKPGYFKTVENEFTTDTLDSILSDLSSATLIFSMPKFSFETASYDLSSILSNLGMPDAFIYGTADFSGIDETKELFIEKVFHKGYIDVNEKGVEAAAVSAISMSAGIVEDKIMTVDHPFILFIRDRRTKTVLFMGRITKL